MAKNKPLNNQQLTDVVADHELRITKLENKKKKPVRCGGKNPPRVTIADVMQVVLQTQSDVSSLNQRINKLETRIDKIESSVGTLNQEVKLLNQAVFKK